MAALEAVVAARQQVAANPPNLGFIEQLRALESKLGMVALAGTTVLPTGSVDTGGAPRRWSEQWELY